MRWVQMYSGYVTTFMNWPVSPCQFSTADLLETIQASKEELVSHLQQIDACEIDGENCSHLNSFKLHICIIRIIHIPI